MLNLIHSEGIKLFSLRSTWIYLALSTGAMFGRDNGQRRPHRRNRRVGMLAAQIPMIALVATAASVAGVVLSVPAVYLMGGSVDFTLTPENVRDVIADFLQWLIFAVLAALLTVIPRSGAFAAMIVVAHAFVVEVVLGAFQVTSLQPVLDLLPLSNIRVLAQGEFAAVGHGRPTPSRSVIAYHGGHDDPGLDRG